MGYNPVMGTIIDLSKPARAKPTPEDAFSRSHFDTEIIHLQYYDNFYSLMDRLHQRDAAGECSPRILLIWPVRGRILETPAEFGRLRGWCVRHHYQAALVIPKDDVHLAMAREQGLPAFRTLKEADENMDWEITEKIPPAEDPQERIRNLALLRKEIEQTETVEAPSGARWFFFILALLSAFAVLWAVLPQARVEITPYLTRKTIDMTIWTDNRLDAPTMGGGIPTTEKKVTLTLESVIPSSGQVRIESGIAVGEVIIHNICTRTVSSTAGSELSTAEKTETGIRFLTLEDVTLAPDEERAVRIEALNGGEESNLPAGSIQYAAYPKSVCWEVRQEKPTSGGSSGIYPAPSEEDRIAAVLDVNSQVREAALAALQNDPESQDLMPLGDPYITSVKQEQYMPEAGVASDTLTLRETLEVAMKTVKKSDREAIIRGQSTRLNVQTAGLIGYEILSGPKEENGLSVWSIRAEYLVYEPETNEEALQIMLRGKPLQQARKILDTLDHVKETRITLLPSFMTQMPLAAQNIHVSIYTAAEIEEP